MSKKLTHEEFAMRVAKVNPTIMILDHYINYDTKLKCMCQNGHVFDAYPSTLLKERKCPYCLNREVLIGFNDLWSTHPEIAKLLKNPEDGYCLTYGSGKVVDFVCPNCGNIIHKSLNTVYALGGLGCQMCSDGVSYPNKFIRQLLDQLDVYFVPEVTKKVDGFQWVGLYRYDCYAECDGYKIFIEMDGGAGHGNRMFNSKKKDTEGIQRDKIKDILAAEHGIEVVRIDCNYQGSDRYQYIKQNILCSKLNALFDLSDIDWDLCDMNAQKNLVKEACDIYMSGIHNLIEIGKILKLHRLTISRYLKRGVEFGWCDYDAKKSLQLGGKLRGKQITVIDTINEREITFMTITDCMKGIKDIYHISIAAKTIRSVCKTNRLYKGFYFNYADKTIQN